MSVERPEWIHCALLGTWDAERGESVREAWCGRKVERFEFAFADASHAALNARTGGRLVLCPGCRDAIINVLREHGSERPPEP